ncbi:MAG: hypothetical protein JW749_07840 [Sedimentisphaerales bacterium]|nr:hypothetical protein [Sedimentisphaerales bacterium]
MRRILLIVAMLLLATAPAMATVTVRAIQNQPYNAVGQYQEGSSCNILDVNYTCDAEEVRAFALEVSVDNGFVISAVSDYKRGESTQASPGYGIFPGSFRTELDPGDVNWVEPNYGPVASTSDPDAAGTGIGTNKVILEMGSLYVGEANKPASSGTLCRLTIDPCVACTPASCTVTFAVNALRGGVVLYDGSSVTPTVVGNGATFSFPKKFPCWEPYRLQYNEWLSVWEPECWAGQCANPVWNTQCYGDTDNKGEGALKYRVYTSDYNKLMAAWGKRATQLRDVNGLDGTPLMCADIDHKYAGALKYRVYTSDYNRLILYWGKRETQLKPFCPVPE